MSQKFEPAAPNRTGAAYIRVSTEDQIEYSPDSQLRKIREYAEAHGIVLQDKMIFADEGISGRSADKRPAFMRMIGAAKQKPRPFDVILVWKFSRFARSRQDSILYKSMLRRDCGIEVISVTEQLNGDPTSILIEALLEAMDEYYSINLAQEVRRGMNEKFSRGGVVSVPPFGYRMGEGEGGEERIFVPDERAEYVRMIYERFVEGESCRKIAAFLNALGVRTVRGNRFESRAVEYILSNPVYIGKQRRCVADGRKMEVADGRQEPLIAASLYEAAAQRLSEEKRKTCTAVRELPGNGYALKGIVRCARCGGMLTRADGGRALQCGRYTKGLCTESHYIRMETLEAAVMDGIERDAEQAANRKEEYLRKGEEIVIRSRADNRERPKAAATAEERAFWREKKKLARIEAAYEEGIDSLEEYREKKAAAMARIEGLKTSGECDGRRGQITAPPSGKPLYMRLSQVCILLRSSEISEAVKNIVLRTLIREVVYHRDTEEIQIIYRS